MFYFLFCFYHYFVFLMYTTSFFVCAFSIPRTGKLLLSQYNVVCMQLMRICTHTFFFSVARYLTPVSFWMLIFRQIKTKALGCLPSSVVDDRVPMVNHFRPVSFSSAFRDINKIETNPNGQTATDREPVEIVPKQHMDHHEEYWKPPPGMVKAPWYRGKIIDPPSILAEETISPADETRTGGRLYDYYEVQELVNILPTVKEKIDFVNPYERQWKATEKYWHRPWMARLLKQRAAWSIPPTPSYFDVLDFFKYVTKTRLVTADEAEKEFEAYYKGINLPTAKYAERVIENLTISMEREEMAKRENHSEKEREENRAKFLRLLIDDAHLTLAHGNPKIVDYRISSCNRCESFWVRAGFLSLYEVLPVWETDEMPKTRTVRFTGDDRRRLGELAFTMRDKHAMQVRTKGPMKKLFEWDNRAKLEAPLFPPYFDVANEVILSPMIYNLMPDKEPLWQCPGYEYDSGETHKYGRLAVKDITPLIKRLDTHWRCDTETERSEVFVECLAATAVISLFNWLNGQAHCLGHTQYTEILAPLASQLILSDGLQMFYFALGQLNTIAINIDVEGFNNRRTNFCCVSGPLKLFDEFDPGTKTFRYVDPSDGLSKDGLNPLVLERILQMCIV